MNTNKMKKMMITAAIVCAATMANALGLYWSGSGIYSSDLTTRYSGDVQLYRYMDGGETVFVGTATAKDGNFSYSESDINSFKASWICYFQIEDGAFTSSTRESFVTNRTLGVPTGIQVWFNNMESETQNASNWGGAVNAPEPTSGLLMLLGVAGLALKRKRA